MFLLSLLNASRTSTVFLISVCLIDTLLSVMDSFIFHFFVMSWIICLGHVIKYFYIHQVLDFPEDQLLVAVFPGVPTAAELFLLPNKNQSEGKKKSEEELEKVGIIWPFRNEWKPVRFRLRRVNVFSLLPNRRPASS